MEAKRPSKNRNLPFPHVRQNPRNQGFSRVETASQGTNKETVPRNPRTLRSPPSTPGGLIAPGTTTSQAPHNMTPNPAHNKRSRIHINEEANNRLGQGIKTSMSPRELSRPQAKETPPHPHVTKEKGKSTRPHNKACGTRVHAPRETNTR